MPPRPTNANTATPGPPAASAGFDAPANNDGTTCGAPEPTTASTVCAPTVGCHPVPRHVARAAAVVGDQRPARPARLALLGRVKKD